MTTRRQLFQFAGGSAVGLALTPAPWRLLTDTALWSENWPGIPRPARGEIRARFTHCALCPAGCAVRARCVGGQPVAMAGAGGGLCAFGITGHHLPYCPDRLRTGDRQKAASAVAAAIAQLRPEERIGVLDLRPGRTASWSYRRAMAALRGGLYLAPEEPAFAVDLAAARTVLSLAAPVVDGWGRPSKVFAARPNFRLIQVEAVESNTAAMADEWLPVRPGSEAWIGRAAAGLATARETAEATGLSEARIAQAVRAVKENGPAVIVTPGMDAEALDWNVRIGAWGKTALPRQEAPIPAAWKKAAPVTSLAAVKDASLRVLLIDASVPGEPVPWAAVAPKLASDAVVVAFAWSRGGLARHATHLLPAAVYPEALGDLPAPVDAPAPEFRLTVPLVAAPDGMVDPAEFIGALAGLDVRNALRERADAIHAASHEKGTPDDFWKSLAAGASWTGGPNRRLPNRQPTQGSADFSLQGEQRSPASASPPTDAMWPFHLILEQPCAMALASPLLSKLSQESRLRLGAGRVALHPGSGFADGSRALLETPYGRRAVGVRLDPSVPPGVALAGGAAELAEIRSADGRARMVRI